MTTETILDLFRRDRVTPGAAMEALEQLGHPNEAIFEMIHANRPVAASETPMQSRARQYHEAEMQSLLRRYRSADEIARPLYELRKRSPQLLTPDDLEECREVIAERNDLLNEITERRYEN